MTTTGKIEKRLLNKFGYKRSLEDEVKVLKEEIYSLKVVVGSLLDRIEKLERKEKS